MTNWFELAKKITLPNTTFLKGSIEARKGVVVKLPAGAIPVEVTIKQSDTRPHGSNDLMGRCECDKCQQWDKEND